jgi:hypothetical protein
VGLFRRRENRALAEAEERNAELEARVRELEAQLDARDRELQAAYDDVDSASAELASSATAVKEALAVIDEIERERGGDAADGAPEETGASS